MEPAQEFYSYSWTLLDLSSRKPRKLVGIPPLDYDDSSIWTSMDLDSMQKMEESDFHAEFRRELSRSNKGFDPSPALPHVFDVFWMDTKKDGSSETTNEPTTIAVCVPFQNSLYWWNGLPNDDGV